MGGESTENRLDVFILNSAIYHGYAYGTSHEGHRSLPSVVLRD